MELKLRMDMNENSCDDVCVEKSLISVTSSDNPSPQQQDQPMKIMHPVTMATSTEITSEISTTTSEQQHSDSIMLQNPISMILAGYNDCSEEAIRYLTDVEHIPEDDQMIVGLRQHLWERQQALNYERLLAQLVQSNSEELCCVDEISRSSNVRTDDGDDSGINSPLHIHSSHEHSKNDMNHESEESFTSEMDDSKIMDSSIMSTTSNFEDVSSMSVSMENDEDDDDSSASDNEDADAMETLMMLAQNNPQIASLTQELFQLLDSSNYDDGSEVQSDSQVVEL